MYGTIPDCFYNRVKMKKIWFQDTLACSNVTGDCEASSEEGFTGSLQTEIGNLKDLQYLILENNPLTGVLPEELGNCQDLSKFGLNSIQLLLTRYIPNTAALLLSLRKAPFISIEPILKAPFPNPYAVFVINRSIRK